MPTKTVDVLIIGAGLSGIGAATHLQHRCPGKTFAVLEGRDNMGGTWDLFQYPGIRSDSDMYTLGYSFRPWRQGKAIADGPSILDYIKQTAEDENVAPHIRYNRWVEKLSWRSDLARWRVTAKNTQSNKREHYDAHFVINCSGYYRYDQGYTPDFPGIDQFQGEVIHPQHWPSDLDYRGKKVVVIGSGATAVTLVPAMAKDAGHVTMLQRSPTYIMSMPDVDYLSRVFDRLLPEKTAYAATRWKNVSLQMAFFQFCRRFPKLARRVLRQHVRSQVGKDFDIDTHFNPDYNPWDQRLCLVPNGDLFRALRKKQASIVTDHIDTFTANGIRLKSGEELEADIVISATGLNLVAMGGAQLEVDDRTIELPDTMGYKGIMLSDVPNLAMIVGYTNASWTLKADLANEYVTRLIKHMDREGYDYCVPKPDPDEPEAPFLDLSAGYVLRALEHLPKQGAKSPWRLYQNYVLDLLNLRFGSVEDRAMHFRNAQPIPAQSTARKAG